MEKKKFKLENVNWLLLSAFVMVIGTVVCCIILARRKSYAYLFVLCTFLACSYMYLLAILAKKYVFAIAIYLVKIHEYLTSNENTAEYIRMDLGHVAKAIRGNGLKVICQNNCSGNRKRGPKGARTTSKKATVAIKSVKELAEEFAGKRKRGRPRKTETSKTLAP